MVLKPISYEEHDVDGRACLAGSKILLELPHSVQEFPMLIPVNLQPRVSVCFQYVFLCGEMFMGIVDEPVEHVLKDLIASAACHGRMELVNEIYDPSVMTIKITDSDAEGLTPMDEFWNICRTAHADHLLQSAQSLVPQRVC
jgi:hypothetical protein